MKKGCFLISADETAKQALSRTKSRIRHEWSPSRDVRVKVGRQCCPVDQYVQRKRTAIRANARCPARLTPCTGVVFIARHVLQRIAAPNLLP